jgi:hypothetical protein
VDALGRTVVQPAVPVPRRRLNRFSILPDTRHDPVEILTVARALMAGSKVMLIDKGNRGQGWVPPEEAVLSRRPAAIEVRADWLAVDSDEPDLFPKLLDLEAALRRDGLRPLVVRSGGLPSAATVVGLRAHLWVQISEPALLAEYKRRAEALAFDVRAGSDLCRPPLSPHRHGHPVAVLGGQPDTPRWQETLQEIGREQRRQEIEATWRRITGDPTWCLPGRTYVAPAAPTKPTGMQRRPLGPKWERLIRDGVPDGLRHQTILSEAIAAVNSHWTQDETFLVIVNGKLGEKILEQGNEAAQRRYFSVIWRKAVARAASPPVPGGPRAQAEVARLRAAASAHPWTPRSGTTDRAVIEAHLDLMARTGKLESDASDRDVAETTGVHWTTVSRADRRLVASGLLVRVIRAGERGFQTSAAWKVQFPFPSQFPISASHALPTGVAKACEVLIGKSHDVFRYGGLGKDTLRIWGHLDALSSVKAAVLARTLGLSLSTLYYHLAKLRKVGLAVKGPGGYLRAGAATLDQVAEVLEVAGVGAAQKVKHQEDRKKHKKARDKWEVERRERMLATMPAEIARIQSVEPAEEMPVKAPVDVLDVVAAVRRVLPPSGWSWVSP